MLEWLATPNNHKWLPIFDNIDQYTSIEQPEYKCYDLAKFFSSADRGSIMITTRAVEVAEMGQSYPIRELPLSEAVIFLGQSAGFSTKTIDDSPISLGR